MADVPASGVTAVGPGNKSWNDPRVAPGRGMTDRGRPVVVTPAEDTDAALLARIAARDERAFRTVLTRHLGAVTAHARRMLNDEAEAEDVAQVAMLRLWQQASQLELTEHGARPWLRRVASNLCIDRIRAGRRTDVTDEVPEEEVPPDQLDGLTNQDLASRVDAALRALPERQRLALTLFQYEGLSQSEIGGILGISDEAVESLLARARRMLRNVLHEDWRLFVLDEN